MAAIEASPLLWAFGEKVNLNVLVFWRAQPPTLPYEMTAVPLTPTSGQVAHGRPVLPTKI